MKTKKLSLENLKVKSFVTEQEKDELKGGCPVPTDTQKPCTQFWQAACGPGSAYISACGNLDCY